MKLLHLHKYTVRSIAILVCLPSIMMAQPVSIPFHKEPYFVDSGVHDGLTGPVAETFAAFHELIQVPGAPWLRLQFQAHNIIGKG